MTVSVKVAEQDNPCHTKLDSIGFQKQTISHQELSRVQHNSHFSLHHHKNLWKKKSDMVLTKSYLMRRDIYKNAKTNQSVLLSG